MATECKQLPFGAKTNVLHSLTTLTNSDLQIFCEVKEILGAFRKDACVADADASRTTGAMRPAVVESYASRLSIGHKK